MLEECKPKLMMNMISQLDIASKTLKPFRTSPTSKPDSNSTPLAINHKKESTKNKPPLLQSILQKMKTQPHSNDSLLKESMKIPITNSKLQSNKLSKLKASRKSPTPNPC